ncbi:CHCH-like protein [Artemisia annua]|uniref:CHCH-like protein n=1 Tax=Artemisia annua TaxID=35608 RepID=A0A2U1NH21_ARTAN|nr:CHCH-like protein [Artemisia annua]
MGQDQSKTTYTPVVNTHDSSRSMESLLVEATVYGKDDENASLEDQAAAKKAALDLDHPFIQGLRSGQCGSQFSDSFLCFLESTHEVKGSDCVHAFMALQRCFKANTNAYPKEAFEKYS